MRARSIKPGLFKNELLGASDPIYTLIFEGLWCCADREGRLEDRPLRIHVEVNPYRPSTSTVLALDWLVMNGFVIRYESGSDKFLQVVNFREHQQPHIKEAPSKIPPPQKQRVAEAPDKHGASTEVAALTPDSGLLTPDSGLLTVDIRQHPASNGFSVPRETVSRVLAKAKTAYPAGTYRANAWLNAERNIHLRLDEGADSADLVAAVVAYAMQQQAMGKVGTEFVLSPAKFFDGEGHWRGPFPLPVAATKPTAASTFDDELAVYRSGGSRAQ